MSDRVRRNERWVELSAVKGWWNEEPSPFSNAHSCDTFVDAGNHLIAPEHKRHCLVLLPAVENDPAVRKRKRLMDSHLVTTLRDWARAFQDNLVNQPRCGFGLIRSSGCNLD